MAKESREAMRPRKEIQWFAREMEKQLRANEHKGGWDVPNIWNFLLTELGLHFSALKRILRGEKVFPTDSSPDDAGRREILDNAADVANFAMMIAEKRGGDDAKRD